jgi:hypothetical protein
MAFHCGVKAVSMVKMFENQQPQQLTLVQHIPSSVEGFTVLASATLMRILNRWHNIWTRLVSQAGINPMWPRFKTALGTIFISN